MSSPPATLHHDVMSIYIIYDDDGQSSPCNDVENTQVSEQQEVRVSQLFNTLLFTHKQEEEQEVRVSELFNTLLFTPHHQANNFLAEPE